MTRPWPIRWWMPVLASLLWACSSTPAPRYYALDRIAERGAPIAGLSIVVEEVAIPAQIDRPQFVLSGAGSEVFIDDLHRWAAPLQSSLAEVLARDLATNLCAADVATERNAGGLPRYRVSVEMLDFRSRLGEEAHLEAAWRVRRDDGVAVAGRLGLSEPAPGRDHSALALAHSRAVAQLSTRIAQAIRDLEQHP